jgi:CubicO group peptidase (beta-lactamase class C family)
MAEPVSRSLYRCLLRVHPVRFRQEFAEEMLWIFDEVTARDSAAPLLVDALASLGRQWLLRTPWRRLPSREAVPAPAAPGSFAWEHIEVPEPPLPVSRMIQGGVVALAFLSALSFTASRPVPGLVSLPHAGSGMGGALEPDWRDGLRASARSNGAPAAIRGNSETATEPGEFGPYATFAPAVGDQDGARPTLILDAGTPDAEDSARILYGQGDAANTPAERQFYSWLLEFNEADKAKLQAFLEKNYPERAKEIDGMIGFRKMTGGFEFKKKEKVDETTFVGIVKERDSDTFARFEIEVEPAEPHRIIKLDLNMIPTPAEFAIPRMTEEQAVAALRSEIERRVAADAFSGAVMVTKNGKTIFSGAYGLADRQKKTKNELDTQFRIGSMNKMFTAVSTLQLVESGKLKLSGTVGEYLPDYPNKDLAAKVTVHHLLTHTGGTGDFFGPEFDKHRLELRTLEDYVKLYGARGLEFEPGSKWDYSNYGFLLLGVIVQKVSGQDYYQYVRQHVFTPAGMTATDSLPEDQAVAKRSTGYTKGRGSETWQPNTDTLPYRGTSAGGGYSTVEDLQKFAEALRNHKLLNAQYTEMLTTGKVDTGGGGKYAYGFMDQNSGGVRSYGHGGGAPGMNGDLTIYPQSGYVVSVLANIDPPAAQRIANFIGNRLPEQ